MKNLLWFFTGTLCFLGCFNFVLPSTALLNFKKPPDKLNKSIAHNFFNNSFALATPNDSFYDLATDEYFLQNLNPGHHIRVKRVVPPHENPHRPNEQPGEPARVKEEEESKDKDQKGENLDEASKSSRGYIKKGAFFHPNPKDRYKPRKPKSYGKPVKRPAEVAIKFINLKNLTLKKGIKERFLKNFYRFNLLL